MVVVFVKNNSDRHFVFFTRTLPHHGIGGMEVLTWDLMTEIVSSGQGKVTVVTTTIPDKPDVFEEEGVNVVAIQEVTPRRYTSRWWGLSANYFDKYLRADVYLVVSVAYGAAGLLFQRKKYLDVPIICQSHGTVVGETISKLRTKNPIQILKCLRQIKYFVREYRVFKHSDVIVAAGEIVNSTLKRFPYKQYVDMDKFTLIENGIDRDEFCPSPENRRALREQYNINQDIPLIVSVARLIKQKGVQQAIYGFNKLLSVTDNVHFLIVGDGREKKVLESLVDELKITNKVTFVGAIQYAELPKYYQMSDVILFPTLRMEGAPLNILEALSAGLPVVASHHLTGSKQISEQILFIDPQDPSSVSEALNSAIKISRNEEVVLPNKYSIPKMTQNYLNLFNHVKSNYI